MMRESICLPRSLLARTEISADAKLLLAAIRERLEAGEVSPSLATLGEDIGRSARQVRYAAGELERYKLVARVAEPGLPSRWVIFEHPWLAPPPAAGGQIGGNPPRHRLSDPPTDFVTPPGTVCRTPLPILSGSPPPHLISVNTKLQSESAHAASEVVSSTAPSPSGGTPQPQLAFAFAGSAPEGKPGVKASTSGRKAASTARTELERALSGQTWGIWRGKYREFVGETYTDATPDSGMMPRYVKAAVEMADQRIAETVAAGKPAPDRRKLAEWTLSHWIVSFLADRENYLVENRWTLSLMGRKLTKYGKPWDHQSIVSEPTDSKGPGTGSQGHDFNRGPLPRRPKFVEDTDRPGGPLTVEQIRENRRLADIVAGSTPKIMQDIPLDAKRHG